MTKPFTITLDAINDLAADNRRAQFRGDVEPVERFGIETDTGAYVDIFVATKGPDGKITGYGRYVNTKLLVRFVQTGTVLRKGWAIRCAIYTATDTGDAAGTLAFDEKAAGGFFNYRLTYVAGPVVR